MSERRLLIMRHAKSSWSSGERDHGRPLSERGERDAPLIGGALSEMGWLPDFVLCSDAARTRQTVRAMEGGLGLEFAKRDLSSLYLPTLQDLLAAISGVDDEVGTLLVVAHNPGCEDVVGYLGGTEVRMTTANVACLKGRGNTWAATVGEPGEMDIVRQLRPKEFRSSSD